MKLGEKQLRVIDIVIFLAALLGVYYFSGSTTDSPRGFCEAFLEYSAQHDSEKIKALVHPEMQIYYEAKGVKRFPDLWLFARAQNIPSGARDIEITQLEFFTREEMGKESGLEWFYEKLPAVATEVIAVSFKYRYEMDREQQYADQNGGLTFFITKFEGSYKMVIPDVADSALWQKHLKR